MLDPNSNLGLKVAAIYHTIFKEINIKDKKASQAIIEFKKNEKRYKHIPKYSCDKFNKKIKIEKNK